jgi:hypothetical protein
MILDSCPKCQNPMENRPFRNKATKEFTCVRRICRKCGVSIRKDAKTDALRIVWLLFTVLPIAILLFALAVIVIGCAPPHN